MVRGSGFESYFDEDDNDRRWREEVNFAVFRLV